MNSKRQIGSGEPSCTAPADLVHDWNQPEPKPVRAPRLVDETWRDGLQSASARDPDAAIKIELIHDMARLGIDGVAIGYPASGARQFRDALALAREIGAQRLEIRPCCAARTAREDVL